MNDFESTAFANGPFACLWLMVSIGLAVFVIPALFRWIPQIIDYYFERFVPTKWHYPFEFAGMLLLILLGVVILINIFGPTHYWQSISLVSVLGTAGFGMIYHRMLTETGCPSCRSFVPYLRREISRVPLREEKKISKVLQNYRSASVSMRKPFLKGERSWDEVVIRKYRIDQVSFVCAKCGHYWDEEEPVLIDKQKKEIEQPPELYRPPSGDG